MHEEWLDRDTSEQVRLLISRRLGPVEHSVDPTPLAGALQIAAGDIFAVNSDASLDEEEITFALLGAFAATIPSMASWFPKHFTPSFQWQRYGKSTRGAGSEGATGADFALIIRLSDKFARAAVFQAKILGEDQGIDLSSISPYRALKDREPMYPEPQILRLARNARTITPNCSDETLTWVHFAAYDADGCFCTPLSDHVPLLENYGLIQAAVRTNLVSLKTELEKNANEAKKAKKAQSKMGAKVQEAGLGSESATLQAQPRPPSETLKNKRTRDEINRKLKDAASDEWKRYAKIKISTSTNSQELIHMLALGASVPPGNPANGWLNLTSREEIKKFEENALTTINIVRMSVAAELTLDLSPESRASLSQRAKIVQRLQAATDEMKRVEAEAGTPEPRGM